MQHGQQASFLARLEEIVRRFPERRAIEEHCGESLSYSQLWARAGAVARHLRAAGLHPGQTVALSLPRSADFVVSFVGCWLAEAVAWPIDPSTPEFRLEAMLGQVCPAAAICRETQLGRLSVRSQRPVGAECDADPWPELPQVAPDTPAYLIYTSGSAGEPKATLVSHAGLVPILTAQIAMFALTEASRCFWMHGIAFDASISDWGTALIAGACLCFGLDERETRDPTALLQLLGDLAISSVDMPPSLLGYLDPRQKPTSLETIVIGGEVCPPAVVRTWAAVCRIVNVYGPTEATICTSMVVCDERWTRPLLGEPVEGIGYSIRDGEGRHVVPGTPGELWIEGDAVALGYPYHPEMTMRRFDFSGPRRVFRSGDLVVASGRHIEFLGRVDRQFKLHGKLICPEEVESVLVGAKGVKRAFVFVTSHRGRQRLAACVEGDTSGLLATVELAARTRLPIWMVPAAWVVLATMPTLPNGKPDAAAIENLLLVKRDTTGASELKSEREKAIADLFCECLDLPSVGREDDFFRIGGDSLAVVAFLSLAHRAGLRVPADIVDRGRTVAGIAALVKQGWLSEAMTAAELRREANRAWDSLGRSRIASTVRDGANGGSILITGATGFLGAGVLGELLCATGCPVVCLVRGPVALAARRVSEGLHRHGFSEFAHTWQARCRLVRGDVAEAHFGLPPIEWESLCREVDTVFHLAADVRLFRSFARLAPANVHGTVSAIELCRTGPVKRLHYASTLSVFVDADPRPACCREEDLRREVTRVEGGYAQSKWVAEQLVLRAGSELGLPVSIYRLGLLTASAATGYAPANDWFTQVLREWPSLDCAVRSDDRERLRCDVTPVDYASRVLVWLARQASAGIYHIANERSVSVGELLSACKDGPISEAALSCPGHCTDLSRVWEGVDAPPHRSLDLFKATGLQFDLTRTKAALQGSGIVFPMITPAYLRSCSRNTPIHSTR